MSIIGEGEKLAIDAIPGVAPAKLGIYAVLGLLAIGVACFLGWWLFIRPAAAQQAAAQAKVEAATSAATAGAAQDTVKTLVVHDNVAAAIDALTRNNDHAIQSAPGASASVGPELDRAGRTAICLRTSHQHQPDCAAVLGNGGSVRPAEPDAWGPAPK